MQRQLKVLNTQLNEAKEEIAVKVAQVKQYQKQVEAYKQQLEQVLCKYLIIDFDACTFATVYCTLGEKRGGGGGAVYSQCTSLLTCYVHACI